MIFKISFSPAEFAENQNRISENPEIPDDEISFYLIL